MLREYEAGLLSPIYKVFRLKESILPSYFYYYMRRDTFIEKIKHYSSGTTRQNFDFNAFEEFELIKPPTGIQKEFESIVTSLESCIKHNNNENKVLSEIRDTLLPKLMSGEIRVPIKSGGEVS